MKLHRFKRFKIPAELNKKTAQTRKNAGGYRKEVVPFRGLAKRITKLPAGLRWRAFKKGLCDEIYSKDRRFTNYNMCF